MPVTDISTKRKKRFSDFADEPKILDGAKTRIDDVLNKELEIIGFKISPSKYPKNASGMCLTIQFIDHESGGRKIAFTGSEILINQIRKYEAQIPFHTTIKKVDRYYLMT